ncbi:MAG: hypothetical protein U9O41_00335 [Candidatus Aerophobetes bacterium]|nr:hypothetical protein [Candidatus Aerophobetes bacterium]
MESHEVEEIKRHFDVIAESLRADIKAIAEGHIILNRKMDILREQNQKEHKEIRQDLNTLREQNQKEHKEILSEVKSSYAELNRRVNILEDK